MLLNTIQAHIIRWIPGHLNIPGNDLVDRVAKQATELPPSTDLPIAFSSALNVIKKFIRPCYCSGLNKGVLQPLPSINWHCIDYYTGRWNFNSKTAFRMSPCITSLLISIISWYWSCLSNMQRRSHPAPLVDNMLSWWLTNTKSIWLSKGKAWVAYHLP